MDVRSNLTSSAFCCVQLEAPPVDQAEYKAYRTATDLREPYRWIKLFSQPYTSCPPDNAIPLPATKNLARLWLAWCRVPLSYLRDTKKFVVPDLPEAPLIVFINSRSGGRAGPALTETLFHALGHSQVWLFWWQFLLWWCCCRLQHQPLCDTCLVIGRYTTCVSTGQGLFFRKSMPTWQSPLRLGTGLQLLYAGMKPAVSVRLSSMQAVAPYVITTSPKSKMLPRALYGVTTLSPWAEHIAPICSA